MWLAECNDNEWYALFVKTGCEDSVKKNLECLLKDKYEFCVPKRLLKIRNKGRIKTEIRTLFPGYILIYGRLDKDDYYLIKKSNNVYYFIMNEDQPLVIHDEEITPIKALLGRSKCQIIGESNVFLENEKIYVKEGPLKTLEGIIVSVNIRKGRAKVRLSIGGKEKMVDLSINIINHL